MYRPQHHANTRSPLQEATLTIAVYDEDWFGLSKQMIGSYSFDLLSVYTKNDEHELRRVWVGLTDTEENNEEVAAQGFLKMSCTVIGPNDPLPLNDPEQDALDEAEREKERSDRCSRAERDRCSITTTFPLPRIPFLRG